jgi:hypothetical protein
MLSGDRFPFSRLANGGAVVNPIRFVLFLTLLHGVLIAGIANGESTWKLPNLNPFAKKAAPVPDNGLPDQHTSVFTMPTMNALPGVKATRTRQPERPSGWSKLASSTKSFWHKTKQALNPWSKSDDKKDRNDAARFQLGLDRNKPEKKSFFAGWLTPKEEEPQRPQSVAEWLAQPRP